MTSTNSATLIAPYSVPVAYGLTLPSLAWMPYMPLIGASSAPLSESSAGSAAPCGRFGNGRAVRVAVVLAGRDDVGQRGHDDQQQEQDGVRRREGKALLLLRWRYARGLAAAATFDRFDDAGHRGTGGSEVVAETAPTPPLGGGGWRLTHTATGPPTGAGSAPDISAKRL